MLPVLTGPVARDIRRIGQLHRQEAQETSQ